VLGIFGIYAGEDVKNVRRFLEKRRFNRREERILPYG
jgi:hypothetical protein